MFKKNAAQQRFTITKKKIVVLTVLYSLCEVQSTSHHSR